MSGNILAPRPNKKLGQHYLNNKQTIDAICNEFESSYEGIIEIGPGPATLTKTLAKKQYPLVLIEKDTRFIEILNSIDADFKLINKDALEVSEKDIFQHFPKLKKWWLVSNLPYNVGTPIMLRFLQIIEIDYFTLMFQKEVAAKVCLDIYGDQKKDKEMNSLHCLVGSYFNISFVKHVPPGDFSPPPKVDSSVISLVRKPTPDLPLDKWGDFEKFLRIIFGQRRKQLGTILKSKGERNKLSDVFNKLKIDPKIRSERLTLSEVQKLFLALEK